MDDPNNNIWPDRLMLRDTQIIPDSGEGRIYTTTGFGYVKEPYVREVLVERKDAEIERLAEELRFANAQIMCDNAAISQWRSIWKYIKSENERLREALEQAYTDGGFTPDEVAEMLADLKGEKS